MILPDKFFDHAVPNEVISDRVCDESVMNGASIHPQGCGGIKVMKKRTRKEGKEMSLKKSCDILATSKKIKGLQNFVSP